MTSREPSQKDVEEGIERRVKAVENDPNLTPDEKARMKAQITGSPMKR